MKKTKFFTAGDEVKIGNITFKIEKSLTGDVSYWLNAIDMSHAKKLFDILFKIAGLRPSDVRRNKPGIFPEYKSLNALNKLIVKLQKVFKGKNIRLRTDVYKFNDSRHYKIQSIGNLVVYRDDVFKYLINLDSSLQLKYICKFRAIAIGDEIKVGCQYFNIKHLRKLQTNLKSKPYYDDLVRKM